MAAIKITPEQVEKMEKHLRQGSRVELRVENGKVVVVSVKRKLI